jgi:hypothetical protein
MAATAEQVAQLRLAAFDPSPGQFTDEQLTQAIERYPLSDAFGREPYLWDTSTTPYTRVLNPDWIPVYDMQAACALVWEWKAAALADKIRFSADGASYDLQLQYEQAKKEARYHRSRRRASSMKIGR